MRHWKASGASLVFLFAAVAGAVGNRITNRLTPALITFAVLVLAGMIVTFTLDRVQNRQHVIEKSVDRSSVRLLLSGSLRESAETDALLGVIARFIFVSTVGRTPFGTLDKMMSSVFLDLFSACTDPVLRAIVARFVLGDLKENITSETPAYVAVAKEGNVLLADEVARQMGLALVVVRTRVTAIRFGNPIEGMLQPGAYVVMVDDVAADGEMLVRVAKRIRRYGGRVEQAFCAVERLDGNAKERLSAIDIALFAGIELDESTLRKIRQLPAAGRDGEPALPIAFVMGRSVTEVLGQDQAERVSSRDSNPGCRAEAASAAEASREDQT